MLKVNLFFLEKYRQQRKIKSSASGDFLKTKSELDKKTNKKKMTRRNIWKSNNWQFAK